MNVGEKNRRGQVLIQKTEMPSTTHDYARIWRMRCSMCGHEYGSNSCDAHIRRCPRCDGGAPGEPLG